jgi:hypothetical protein
VDIAAYANPYDALIEACEDDPVITPSLIPSPNQPESFNTGQVLFIKQSTDTFRYSSKPVMTLIAQHETASKRPNFSPPSSRV